MAAQLNPAPFSRVCSYCRTGIQSSALFVECTYCRLPFCISCRFKHQASHQQAIVVVRSVIHRCEVKGEEEVCSRCSKRVSFAYACCECEYALCRSCWFEQDIDTHQHKTFNVIELPRLVKSKAGVAAACCAVPAVNHCSTCAVPFSLGQETILCKTCYLRTNERVYFCVRCYISPEESHPRHHESWQWTVEVAMPGGLGRGIHCNECLQAMRSVEDLKAHPHTSYANVYTERHLNQIIARSYRQCQKKAVRVDDMMAEGSDRCTMCLQKTVSSSILPCRQCNETNRLCAHCGQHASKLHIHGLPTSDSSGSPRTSSATVTQNISVDTPPRSSISIQSPQSPINVRSSSNPVPNPVPIPVPIPVPSPVPSAVSNASHRSASLPAYPSIQPPWDRSYNENEPFIIEVGCEYPLQQGQDVPHCRSFSDPTVALPRSRTPLGSPQPYPRGPPHSRPVQHPQHVQLGKNSQPASPPSSPQPNPTGSPYRTPTQPSQPRQTPQPESPTPPISLRPDSYRPSSSRPGQLPQPKQSSHPASPSPPTLHQPNPTRPSHNKSTQPTYPSQSSQPVYPNQSPQPVYPSQSPQPAYPNQSPQPAYPSQSSQPVYPSQSSRPVYPSQSPQLAYPNQNSQPPYPSQSSQPVYPSQSPQPVYPSQSPQPTYPSQSSQPVYPSQSPQPVYPSQSPQPTYPSQNSQPAYPSQNSQPAYPSQNSQPAYPSQSPQPAYPSHSPQPTYPSQNSQPPYPSQNSQPPYPSQNSQPAYPSQSPQPVYPSQSPQPAYTTQPTSGQQNLTDALPSSPTQPPHPTQHPQLPAPTTPDILSTPPVQRLSSAPQVLISTPEHPQEEVIPQQKRNKMAGFKKAYDITQKNAATRFVTRVAAKTAFSAVSNVIGADIGGVVDAAGGLNLGGTGIDGGSLVGKAVTSAADAAFDEALGEDGRPSHSGGRWKTMKPSIMGRR